MTPLEQLLALLWWLTIGDRLPVPAELPKTPEDTPQPEEQRIARDRGAYERRRAIQRCPDCNPDGELDWSSRGGVRFTCPHDPCLYRAAHDARRAEIAAAQEAWEVWNEQPVAERQHT
jgi:hypothetical protein